MRFGNILVNVRRLHARGSTGRGMVVDHGGAMLGPDCVLVQRTAHGYRCATRSEVATVQEIVFGNDCRPNWLFDQCCRIAEALNDNQVALAQIYGVHAAPITSEDRDRKSFCIERCSYLLERPLPYRWSNVNTFAFFRCVNDCMREMA
jgi:hypothetical protein